jgi:hypothetical protein
MSLLACDIRVDGEDAEQFVVLPICLYVLNERRLATLDCALVWCDSCQDFQAGESLDSTEWIESELARYRRGEVPEGLTFIYGEGDERAEKIVREIASLERKLHWRRMRRSPPRCLNCGSIKNRPIHETDPDSLLHPITKRHLKLSWVFAFTSLDHSLFAYTAEGELLGEISRVSPDSEFLDDAAPYEIIAQRLRGIGVQLPQA